MTTTTAPAACIDPDGKAHEHCPEHGCVEYVCCVPTVPDLTDQNIRADLQDLVYSVQYGARRSATMDDTMGPLMALVQRFADLQARQVPTTVYVVVEPKGTPSVFLDLSAASSYAAATGGALYVDEPLIGARSLNSGRA